MFVVARKDGSGSLAKERDRVVAVEWTDLGKLQGCILNQQYMEFVGRMDYGSQREAGRMRRLRQRWRAMTGNGGLG